MLQAFLKEDQAAYAAISVLEGRMRSNATWKATMSSKVLDGSVLYSDSSLRISSETFSGSVVSLPPTSLGNFLYSPTANQSLRLSLVPVFSTNCSSLISFSVSAEPAWSITPLSSKAKPKQYTSPKHPKPKTQSESFI